MKFRILPIRPCPIATESGTMKMQLADRIFRDANVATDKEVAALCTDACLIE